MWLFSHNIVWLSHNLVRFLTCNNTLLCEKKKKTCSNECTVHTVTLVSQTETDDAGSSDGSGCTQSSTQRTPIHKPFTQCRPPADWPQHPVPVSVSEDELHFVRGCLQRWRTEAENNMNGASSSWPFRHLRHFFSLCVKYYLDLCLYKKAEKKQSLFSTTVAEAVLFLSAVQYRLFVHEAACCALYRIVLEHSLIFQQIS